MLSEEYPKKKTWYSFDNNRRVNKRSFIIQQPIYINFDFLLGDSFGLLIVKDYGSLDSALVLNALQSLTKLL